MGAASSTARNKERRSVIVMLQTTATPPIHRESEIARTTLEVTLSLTVPAQATSSSFTAITVSRLSARRCAWESDLQYNDLQVLLLLQAIPPFLEPHDFSTLCENYQNI